MSGEQMRYEIWQRLRAYHHFPDTDEKLNSSFSGTETRDELQIPAAFLLTRSSTRGCDYHLSEPPRRMNIHSDDGMGAYSLINTSTPVKCKQAKQQ